MHRFDTPAECALAKQICRPGSASRARFVPAIERGSFAYRLDIAIAIAKPGVGYRR